ncbi:MAG: helix-turn-helix domain-containing protein [Pirellulales bacterium]|nr:helix-turn-helix domain-containing protein [Pirellulales bacterium]
MIAKSSSSIEESLARALASAVTAAMCEVVVPAIRETLRESFTRAEQHQPINVGLADAAVLLSISESQLHRLARRGVVPSLIVGGRRLFSVDALREWVQQSSGANRKSARQAPRKSEVQRA